jgi:hypothetical protein
MSPHEALYHTKPIIVADVLLNSQLNSDTKPSDVSIFIHSLRRRAAAINLFIEKQTAVARETQKQYYDRFVRDKSEFNVDDSVKIKNFRTRVGHNKSFEPKSLGPFTVSRRLGDLTYELISPTSKPQSVHYNRLHHYNTRKPQFQDPQPNPAPVGSKLIHKTPVQVQLPPSDAGLLPRSSRTPAGRRAAAIVAENRIEQLFADQENDEHNQRDDRNDEINFNQRDNLNQHDNLNQNEMNQNDEVETHNSDNDEENHEDEFIDFDRIDVNQPAVEQLQPVADETAADTATVQAVVAADTGAVEQQHAELANGYSRCNWCLSVHKLKGMHTHKRTCATRPESHIDGCGCEACADEQ